MARQAWCSGCNQLHSLREMGFAADGWHYWCAECRHPELVLDPPAPRQRRSLQPVVQRFAPVAAAAVLVVTVFQTNSLQRQAEAEQHHVEDQIHASQAELPKLGVPIPYPPVGYPVIASDAPPEPSGAHYHCEQGGSSYMNIGIDIGGSYTQCSWRWPDGSLAPAQHPTP